MDLDANKTELISSVIDYFRQKNNKDILQEVAVYETEIKELEENKISIEDEDNKTKTTFTVTKTEFNSDKKQLELELIGANVALPKQRLEINLIRMDENQCFIIFKHIILEFIPFDILMSYSSSKKKVLKRVKNILEGKGDKFE